MDSDGVGRVSASRDLEAGLSDAKPSILLGLDPA